MAQVEGRGLVPAARDVVGDGDRAAAAARLRDLFGCGRLSLDEFYGVLGCIFDASSRTDLEAVMRALPPPVELTPVSLRLAAPLVLRIAGATRLGEGWQLGATTSVTTGVGTTQLDLNAATWDALEIELHLETWGLIEVLVPRGVTVQMAGGSGRVRIEPMSATFPGGPVLRIKISGPAGAICVRHLEEPAGRPFTGRRPRSAAGSR